MNKSQHQNLKIKAIPKLKNEDEEAKFWLSHDLTDYFDVTKRVRPNFVNLKPSTQSVTFRLPQTMVESLKMLANEQDVPYQSLMKMFLDAKIKEAMVMKQRSVGLK